MNIDRIIIIIIDSCGVGALPDADKYNDNGTSTIPHVAEAAGGVFMPNCRKLGLGNIVPISGIPIEASPIGSFGKMAEMSAGKDSTIGHWEIGGLVTEHPLPVFPNGFPSELVQRFEQAASVKTIGNIPASGTEIIERLGEHHLQTKDLILYTSADSVFQLAAHEDLYPPKRLYEICQIARDMLTGENAVARVIARPFIGTIGNFRRTANRKDFSLKPTGDTILDLLIKNNYKTLAIGKIYDLYNGCGITHKIKTASNIGGMMAVHETVKEDDEHQLVFANLVDFDMNYGHRRDAHGFAKALEQFDVDLGNLLPCLRNNDLLLITADHGCDPTYEIHTDHTREYVPLIAYGNNIKAAVNLGIRNSFTDIAVTIADIFKLDHNFYGQSFLEEITP